MGSTRWAGVERPYATEDVERIRGRFHVEHTLATASFWEKVNVTVSACWGVPGRVDWLAMVRAVAWGAMLIVIAAVAVLPLEPTA